MKKVRTLLWRILGFDYKMILNKTDYVLLKNDQFYTKGKGTYDNGAKVWRWTESPLIIGKYCSIAHNVNFIVDEGFHTVSEITNYPFVNNLTTQDNLLTIKNNAKQKEGIIIGNDVWIGLNVIILPGVKIGNGVTIATGSVVNRDIPDYAIAAGVPAKVLKMKQSDEIIEKLNKIAWWNWDDTQIHERKKDFYLSMEEFIKNYSE